MVRISRNSYLCLIFNFFLFLLSLFPTSISLSWIQARLLSCQRKNDLHVRGHVPCVPSISRDGHLFRCLSHMSLCHEAARVDRKMIKPLRMTPRYGFSKWLGGTGRRKSQRLTAKHINRFGNMLNLQNDTCKQKLLDDPRTVCVDLYIFYEAEKNILEFSRV